MRDDSAMTRTERTFYLLFGSYSLAQFFLAPVYPLFLLSRGLDLLEINLILAIYLITVFVFEVPTGALADTAGRRFSFVLGCATRTAAFVLYSLALGSAFAAFPIHMYWQPRLQALAGGQLRVMGWIVALLALASLTGSALVPPVVRRFARESVLFAAMLWRGAMVALLAGAASLSPALAGLLLQETAFGVID